jgi:NADH pyrophosphatase NudC (nudix superfamily)
MHTDQIFSPEPNALYMVIADGEILASVSEPRAVAWLRRDAIDMADDQAYWLALGSDGGEQRYAAIRIGEPKRADAKPIRTPRQSGFLGLHQLRQASAMERQWATRAVHIGAWLHRSRFCGSCGAATSFEPALNKRMCSDSACGYELYPRIEPAIITLVTDGERCLLARQASFPPGFYAPIAGFIEAGETPEQAVAREVAEETGLHILGATYMCAQPWPHPASLMLGFAATAAADSALTLSAELQDARWFGRDELAAALQQPGQGQLHLPPRGVIGHVLLQQWLGAPR